MKKVVFVRLSKSGEKVVFLGAEVSEEFGFVQNTGQVAWVTPQGQTPQELINKLIEAGAKAKLDGEGLDATITIGRAGHDLMEG